jgi:site-specific DNA-methyltransferase (adenine-specific)
MDRWDLPVKSGRAILGECLAEMALLPSASVDMILCDLPYGTTRNKWDSVIPFAPLWEQYWRVCKPHAAIVLTAAQPFTSALVCSQIDRFKYSWAWVKEPSGNLNAKKMPMPAHEDVLVFGAKFAYNPQGLTPTLRNRGAKDNSRTENYGAQKSEPYTQMVTNYPRSVLEISKHDGREKGHPTQKPIELFEYLIKTYSNPGDHVLDNCSGSGTTAIAAEQCGRRWTCIERDPAYYWASVERIARA